MREPLKDRNRLEHMLNAIDTILQRTSGLTLEELTADKILFGGIIYYTMIIGEAAYKLSRDFVNQHTEMPWQDIADMRHHLVHGYYQVDSCETFLLRRVWKLRHEGCRCLPWKCIAG